MHTFVSWEIAAKANKWAGRNVCRWSNPEYDALYRAAQRELDVVKRAALFIKMNDLVVNDLYIVPIANRPIVSALGKSIRAQLSSWSSDVFLIQDWYRDA